MYQGLGPQPLVFSLYISNRLKDSMYMGPASPFNQRWTHTYFRSLFIDVAANTATAYRHDGKVWNFNAPVSGNVYLTDADVTAVLTRLTNPSDNSTTGWTLQIVNGDVVETYSPLGVLLYIDDRNGLRQTLTYSDGAGGPNSEGYYLDNSGNPTIYKLDPGYLLRVTDALGRTLKIGYNHDVAAGGGRPIITQFTDPAGQITRFHYDGAVRMDNVTFPDGGIRTYRYGSMEPNLKGGADNFDLVGIYDENTGILTDANFANRYANYSYDSAGRAITTELGGFLNAGVNRYTVTYNSNGTSTVTDPLNTVRTYGVQEASGLAKVTSSTQPCNGCNLSQKAITYDANGNVASITDWNDNRTNYTYDLTRNLPTQRVEGLTSAGATTTLTRTVTTQWHANYRLPVAEAEPLRITSYVYNGDTVGGGTVTCGYEADGTTPVPGVLCRKTVQATTDASGASGFSAISSGTARVWNYTYNANGSVLTASAPPVTTAGGSVTPVTTYTYYANNATCATSAPTSTATGCRGQIASITNALGQTTQIPDYNGHGQPLTVVDPNALNTTLTYDPRMRLTSRNTGGETTTYTHDYAGQLIKLTRPDGSYLEYDHDLAHRLTEIRLRDNANTLIGKTTYTLDAMGNRTAEQIKDPSNAVLQAHTREYNSLNRLIKDIGATSPSTQITTYAYDTQGNLASVTAPSGAGGVRSYTYDALNRLATQVDPATPGNPSSGAGTTAYAYSGLDQVTGVTDPRLLATSYTYDGLNNLTQQVSPDTGTTANTYDTAGNILGSTDAKSQSTSYLYDALSRVSSVTYNQASGSQLKTVAYQYDSGTYGIGHLTQATETSAGGATLQITTYKYDQKGRLTEENRDINGVAYVTSYTYDTYGRLSGMTYPTGRQITYTLDGLGRISGITTSKGGGSPVTVLNSATWRPFGPMTGFTFGNSQVYQRPLDSDGRVTSYTSQPGTSLSLTYDLASRITQLGSTTYAYDEIDRLIGVNSGTQTYAYDTVGNRLAKVISGTTDSYTYSGSSNQVTAISGGSSRSYGYDLNGSTTGDGSNTYTYDGRGRLVQSSNAGAGTTAYQVNSTGQRVQKSNAAGNVLFHYDAQGHLIAETTPLGAQKEYIYFGDTPVAVFQ